MATSKKVHPALKIAQLRPPRSEELASCFERWAAEAREGSCTGYSLIAIRPGGHYTTDGWQSSDANALQEVGMHVFAILDIWMNSRRQLDDKTKQ